jgi:hypothetical protein
VIIFALRGLLCGVRAGRDATVLQKLAIEPITGSEGRDSKAAIEVITDLLASKPGSGPASSCEPYRELIAQELERGRNAMGIWQDLVDSHGFAGGYQSVRRFVRGAATPKVRAIIETPAGKNARLTTARGRWCAIRRVANIGARGCLYSHWVVVGSVFACWSSVRVRGYAR